MRSGAKLEAGYDRAKTFLRGLKGRGVTLGLDRMRRFLAEVGEPQKALRCIHVAGTNGKGSVAAMLESILRTAGWKTGLYTSPHLVKLGERVQVNRNRLGDDELAAAVLELAPAVGRIVNAEGEDSAPSYFEFMTALAFRVFIARGCDIAIIEVGLGGRLDATNVVMPELSVITSIGFDHCEILGHTLAEIAAEKAGIIKNGVPVVIGRVPDEAERMIRSVASEKRAPVITVGESFGPDPANYPTCNLTGEYQRLNAATATLAARTLPNAWGISESAIKRGLANVIWPGRWQRWMIGGRSVIVDASHNAEGATVLDANLRALVAETGRAPIIVVGVLGTVRAASILDVVVRHARSIHLVVPQQSRACTFSELRAAIPPNFRGPIIDDRLERLFPTPGTCAIGEVGDTVVITGSIYLAGETLALLDPRKPGNDNDLQDF